MHTPEPFPGMADAEAELAVLRAENELLRRALRERERVEGEWALARVLDAFADHPDAQMIADTEEPLALWWGDVAWALLLVRHATPAALNRALGVPVHVAWAAAERVADGCEMAVSPCDACAVPCVPVEARGFNLCASCAEGDPRRIPGWALLCWAWRFLRAEQGRPPTRAELTAIAPRNYDTARRWWAAAGPVLAEWMRVERVSGEILLGALSPRNDAEQDLVTLREPRRRA